MLYRVKKISVIPVSVILLILQTIIGLAIGVVVALGSMSGLEAEGIWALGPWAILILPILNGILGFVTGIVLAFFYNIIVGIVGKGVELELEEV